MISISGIGGYFEGVWKFCFAQQPAYAVGLPAYKPILADFPTTVSEALEVEGGVARMGELSFTILDHEDQISSQFRWNRPSVTRLAEDLDASETSVDVDDATNIPAQSIIYVRSEAMRVQSKAGTTLTVTRGALDTLASAHDEGDPIDQSLTYPPGSIVRLYLAPTDGGSDADEVLLGEYFLDGISQDDRNTWAIQARSGANFLSRMVASDPRVYEVGAVVGDPEGAPDVELIRQIPSPRFRRPNEAFPESTFWLIGEEIIRAPVGLSGLDRDWLSSAYFERGILGTPKAPIERGMAAFEVCVADKRRSSFRYSPGPSPSESRSSGTWLPSQHVIDVLMCILTSSASDLDGLELTNHLTSGSGAEQTNWSCLPPGMGLGIPIDKINVPAMLDIRQRTDGWNVAGFYIGNEPINFAALAEDAFLRALGIALTMSEGKITAILARSPLMDESAVAMDQESLMVEQTGNRLFAPVIRNAWPMDRLINRVIYKVKNWNGDDHPIVVFDPDAPKLRGTALANSGSAGGMEIPCSGARTNVGGTVAFLGEAGLAKIRRWTRPRTMVSWSTDVSLYAVNVGDLVAMTEPDQHDAETGTRGWTERLVMVESKTWKFGETHGAWLEWTGTEWGRDPSGGRIAPAAQVDSVGGSIGAPVVTVIQNKFTQADAVTPLPTTDASAFTVGDVVALFNLDGSRASTEIESVTDISGDTIELTGDFDGDLAEGLILSYADRDDAEPQQYEAFVYLADRATLTVGSSTDGPWSFADR